MEKEKSVSLKDAESLAREFFHDENHLPYRLLLITEAIEALIHLIRERDAEHEALQVTTDVYSKGFANGWDAGRADLEMLRQCHNPRTHLDPGACMHYLTVCPKCCYACGRPKCSHGYTGPHIDPPCSGPIG